MLRIVAHALPSGKPDPHSAASVRSAMVQSLPMTLLANLNPQQYEAVTTDAKQTLVLAGPGSGKTRVLTQRIAYLVKEQNIAPYQILAVTFTNKAARVMRTRVETLLEQQLQDIWLGTFHSICARLLRRETNSLPYKPNFVIFDEGDQETLVKRAIRELNIDEKSYRPAGVLASISNAKNELLLPQDYPSRTYRDEVVRRVYERYQTMLVDNNALDFDDLLFVAVRLLRENPDICERYSQRLDHLLVDEFQDTNPTQWRLLLPLLQEMASGTGERQRSVFLVGDGKQSIYRFRRAEPRLFHTAHNWLQQHLHADAWPLHVSYRSAPAIMECVNRVFDAAGPLGGVLDAFTPHDTHHTALWGRVEVLPLIEGAATEPAPPREVLRNPLVEPRVVHEDQRHLEEGRQIAATIGTLMAAGTLVGPAQAARPLRYGDVMLLVRKRAHVHAYEQALREAGIPYLGADRGTLLHSLEVDDMVRLLETLIAPYNNLALAQVLRSPLFACSDEDLIGLAHGQRGAWFERLLQTEAPAATPLRRAADALGRWHALAGALPIHDLLDKVYSEGNVIARYEAAFPAHLRPRLRANLTRFLELALEIDNGRYPSLTRFLARLGEMREQDEAPDEAPAEAATDRVRLMTIHAAKGLEASVVFLADAASAGGNDRPWHAQVGWPAEADAPEHLLLVGRKEQQDAFTRAQLEQEQAAERREAANLLYVALTRARQLLYISGCRPNKGNTLGWYGDLQQVLAEPIESNRMPAAAGAAAATAAAPVAAPPPALRAVLQVRPLAREIAPSRSVHGHGGDGSDEDGRLRGIAIHRMLELLTAGTIAAQVPRQVAAELQRRPDDGELAAWWREAEAVHQAPQFRELFDPTCYRQAWNEVPLQYTHEGCTVYGLIDRLVLTDDEVIIVDYKTHRQAAERDPAQLAAPYATQMAYYAAGVRRLWPQRRVRPLLLFTAAGTTVAAGIEIA